jgi:hypothetical protein
MDIKLLFEKNDDNYGHKNIIYKGDIYFPPRDEFVLHEIQEKKPFDKNKEIDNMIRKKLHTINENDYFEIYRYCINKCNKPNDSDGPTFSFSLFLPNNKLNKEPYEYKNWIENYYFKQIINILVINYYFPESNIVFYFDHYLLEKFKKTKYDDPNLDITNLFKTYEYNDYHKEKGKIISNFIESFSVEFKKYTNYKFNNFLEKFIFTYDLASKYYKNNVFKNKTSDFFVYRFKEPFLENINTVNEGHITNGYLGQYTRILILRRKEYNYNGTKIKIHKHILFRDSHATLTCYEDYKVIKKVNLISKKNKELYFFPKNFDYCGTWHDHVISDVNNLYYKTSFQMGQIQIINCSLHYNDNLYLKTIGLPFILNSNNELVIKNHRPLGVHYKNYKHILKEYDYGLDEYIISSFLIEKYFHSKIIYLKRYFQQILFDFYNLFYDSQQDYYYYISISQIIILNYLKNKNLISNSINYLEAFNAIEDLRNNKYHYNKIISYLLNIIPNKSNLYQCIYFFVGEKNDEFKRKFIWDQEINIKQITKKISKYNKNILKLFKNINYETIKFFNLDCEQNEDMETILLSTKYPVIKRNFNLKFKMKHFSGYYSDNPKSLELGIFRNIEDLNNLLK